MEKRECCMGCDGTHAAWVMKIILARLASTIIIVYGIRDLFMTEMWKKCVITIKNVTNFQMNKKIELYNNIYECFT